jgi:hypothetical protein
MFLAYAAFETVRLAQPAELGGSSLLPRLHTTVRDELEINLLVLTDGVTILAFLAIDTLFAGEEMTAFAKRAVCEHFGSGSQLIVAASHTHNAPMLDRSKLPLGKTSDAFEDKVKQTIKSLLEKASASNQNIAYRTTIVTSGTHGVNRRLTINTRLARAAFLKRKKTFMAPNALGPVDNTMRCLLLRGLDGKVVAALLQVACHPTGYPDRLTVTADYVAKLRSVLRMDCGEQLPVIFLQGFSGDVRPQCEGHLTARAAARRFISGPGFQALTVAQWEAWSDSMSVNLHSALLQQKEMQPLTGNLSFSCSRLPLNGLLAGYSGSSHFEAIRFCIGNTVSGVAVNAEMLAGWLDFTPEHFFTVGCVNDTFGYLPDARSVAHAGYEVDGFLPYFGLKATGWKSNYDKQVRAALREEARPTRRQAEVIV